MNEHIGKMNGDPMLSKDSKTKQTAIDFICAITKCFAVILWSMVELR